MGNSDIYVDALRALCGAHGGPAGVARRTGLSAENIKQILKGVPLPSGNPRGVGPGLRKSLSEHFPNWLDKPTSQVAGSSDVPSQHQINRAWPFATVAIERFEALGYEQKVIVEDALVQAIERMEQRAASKGKADAARIDSTPQPKRGNGG